MPNISVSLTDEQIKGIEYLIDKKNEFLSANDIPLEVTRSGVIADIVDKEIQRVKDIWNDNPAS